MISSMTLNRAQMLYGDNTYTRTCCACGEVYVTVNPQSRKCGQCRVRRAAVPVLGRELSFRERQVADRLEKRNKEIAYDLHLTEGTIKEYINTMFKKTGTETRTELALWWWRKKQEEVKEQ